MKRWLTSVGVLCVLMGITVMVMTDERLALMPAASDNVMDESESAASEAIDATQFTLPTDISVPTDPPTIVPTETWIPEPTPTFVPSPTPLPQLTSVDFTGACFYMSSRFVQIYASASGIAPASNDDAGFTTTYEPDNMLDCNASTAWRVEYSQQPNPTISFGFSEPVVLSRFGFVPGYDKRDPWTDQWRWYQNRRISETTILITYQDGETCSMSQSYIADSPDIAWIDVRSCRVTQNGLEWPVVRVDVRVEYSRPPASQPVRNFIVVGDAYFEGFVYER
jgi:hypothetical protein